MMNHNIGNRCPTCDAENRPGARFCVNCGIPLTSTVVENWQEESTGVPAAPVVPFLPPEQDASMASKPEVEEKMDVSSSDLPVSPPLEQEGEASVTPQADSAPALAVTLEPPLLPPGHLLAGRYQIIEQIPTASQAYLVYDLRQCPACHAELEHPPTDDFCPTCGILLDTYPIYQIQPVQIPVDLPALNPHYITHDGFTYLAQPVTINAHQDMTLPRYFHLRFGCQSHKGQVREVDEDSILTLTMTTMFEGVRETTLGLFIVSDGIGGHQAGEVASRQAIQMVGAETISRVLQRAISTGRSLNEGKLEKILKEVVAKANGRIYEAQQESGNDMGATITAALIYNQTAIVANVGDSRTYLWRGGELKALTQDHSLVASLIAADQLPEEAIYTHEQKGMIYRSLGNKPDIKVDTFALMLAPADRLVLCCDGVWETIRNEGIEEVLLLEPDPQRACDEMVKRANYTGGEDNISVIVVVVDPVD